MAENKFMGRVVKEHITFLAEGTFKSYYLASGWCREKGYGIGSMCGDMPIGITKGEYNLTEKWRKMKSKERKILNGVMVSNDFREAQVEVYIFNYMI